MKRITIMLGVSITFGVIGCEHLHSQEQPRISRTDVSGRTALCDGTMQLRGDIFDSGFFGEQSGP